MSENKKFKSDWIIEALEIYPTFKGDMKEYVTLIRNKAEELSGFKISRSWVKRTIDARQIIPVKTEIEVEVPEKIDKDPKKGSLFYEEPIEEPKKSDVEEGDQLGDQLGDQPRPAPTRETEEEENGDKEPDVIRDKKEKLLLEIMELKSIGNMVGLPFRLIAHRTGFKGFELTNEEKAEIDSCTPIVNYYLPELLDKYFPVVYLGWVFAPIIANKVLDYSDWKKSQPKTEKKK